MADKRTAPVVVMHRGARWVLTASGVSRVAPAPTMGAYLAAKRSREGR
jgi:hypothetical protein